MLGAFAGLTAELFTGKSIIQQYSMGAFCTSLDVVQPDACSIVFSWIVSQIM